MAAAVDDLRSEPVARTMSSLFGDHMQRLVIWYVVVTTTLAVAWDAVQWQLGISNLGVVVVLLIGAYLGLMVAVALAVPFVLLASWGEANGRRWPGAACLGTGIVLGAAAWGLAGHHAIGSHGEDVVWDLGFLSMVSLVSVAWGISLFTPVRDRRTSGGDGIDRSEHRDAVRSSLEHGDPGG